jgi:hypothetical protein
MKELLHPISVKAPFHRIGIDIVGPLPITPRSNKYIVVATDYMTKWPEARAIPRANAQEVAKFIYEDIICRHGCPSIILSDQGSHFRNRVIDELLAAVSTKHHCSTPYHPQTNGLVERFNKTLCSSIAKLVDNVTDWDLLIPPILFAYRTAKQATTKETPFYLVYGRQARLPLHPSGSEDILHGTIIQRLYEIDHDLPEAHNNALYQISKEQQKQKERHDRQIKATDDFNIGEKVLVLDARKLGTHSHKLMPKWKGPYYIHATPKNGAYKLRELGGRVLASPINKSLLKPYHERKV